MRHLHNAIKKYIKDKKENLAITILEIIRDLPIWFFFALEIYVPIKILNLPSQIDYIVNIVFLFLVTLEITISVIKILTYLISGVFKKKNMKGNKTAKKTIQTIVNVSVWVIAILIFLMNIGVDLTPLVASLWVASIAVAFSLQNLLADLFASFSIVMSRPFEIWDFIAVWEWTKDRVGTVTDVTLKSTHLMSTAWQEIVIPNSAILSTEILNYGKMKHRRKRFKIWVMYDTPTKKLEKIPKLIENIIKKNKNIRFEWAYLFELNTYSIDYYISYDTDEIDYVTSLKVQEKIMFSLLEIFEKEWINFAYPTQIIHTPDIKK